MNKLELVFEITINESGRAVLEMTCEYCSQGLAVLLSRNSDAALLTRQAKPHMLKFAADHTSCITKEKN